MRRAVNWVIPCALAALLLSLLTMPEAAISGARDGLLLWAQHVLPSLLPYFILSQMLIESGAVSRVGRALAVPARALFRLPGTGAPALLLAYLSGSPSGARIAGQLAERGQLDAASAARFTAAGAMTGPLFLAATAGGMLGDSRAGLAALCACLLAAALNGLLWRFYGAPPEPKEAPPAPLSPALRALPAAIRDSCAACITVGGSIALFSVFIALATETGLLSLAALPLRPLLDGDLAQALLTGVLEMTNGMKKVAELPLALEQRTAIVAALGSFGGLSIAAQASLFLRDIVPMRLYLLQRATQAVIGYVAGAAITPIFLPGEPASTGLRGFCMPCVLTFLIALLVVCLLLFALNPVPRLRRREYPCNPKCAHRHPGCTQRACTYKRAQFFGRSLF